MSQILLRTSAFLNPVITALHASKSIDSTYKRDLEQLFWMMLQYNPDLRNPDFSTVVEILSPHENRLGLFPINEMVKQLTPIIFLERPLSPLSTTAWSHHSCISLYQWR
jgi:hypothetical protein